jgi:hypothetical protein
MEKDRLDGRLESEVKALAADLIHGIRTGERTHFNSGLKHKSPPETGSFFVLKSSDFNIRR